VSEGFRVPKRTIPVDVTLAGQAPAQLALYLSEHAERHSGTEYPSDLLNGGDEFMPATEAGGRIVILRRRAIMVLSVAAEHEEVRPSQVAGDDQVTTVTVELQLEDGTYVNGELCYWRPEGKRRVQDYMNTADEFIPVWEGDVVHLVNREKVISLAQP
jgi:hypothetical protein